MSEKTLKPSDSQEGITESEKRSFFRKWFRWDVITGIATLIMLGIAIWALIPPTPLEAMKENIKKNCGIVKTTFDPQLLAEEEDSCGYNLLLAQLQRSTLDYCSYWEMWEGAEPFAKHSNKSRKEIALILSEEFNRYDKMLQSAESIREAIRAILQLEQNIDVSNRTNISAARIDNLIEYTKLKSESFHAYQTKALSYINKANNTAEGSLDEKKEIKKGLQELDKIKEDINAYKLDNELIEYAIECNNSFMISRRHYMNKKHREK